MKNTLLLLTVCFAVGAGVSRGQSGASVQATPGTPPAEDSVQAKIDKLFAAWDKPETPGAALAVVRDGVVIYKRGYGIANLEYAVPITPSTVFHVASVSKQFTAFAVMLLMRDGKLSLETTSASICPKYLISASGSPYSTCSIIRAACETSGSCWQWPVGG
jgi:CubicO group peptidase (beta-lactamase class C family)